MQTWPGSSYPLGATFDGNGTNFALFSEGAERVELCLFGDRGKETRIDLIDVDAHIWHAYLPHRRPRPALRLPGARRRTTRSTASASTRTSCCSTPTPRPSRARSTGTSRCSATTSAIPTRATTTTPPRTMMKGVVINPFFDWAGDRQPKTPYAASFIYEAHVKGLTMLHPAVPEELRGTYGGIAHPAVIDHLKKLGVTAIELMPVHQFVNDSTLQDKGLSNYWGYNTIAFFAPQNTYAATGQRGQQVQEFKGMVRALHAADIEVILDVVYNHTAEGNHLGPTLSMRGIDNAAYYRLEDKDQRYYTDYTGTGNSLNVGNPHALQLIMDSLRYWVLEMHVDGFRFDLAATLAREFYDVDRLATFFELVQQDPVVSQVKLIAEPWDIGPGGYQVGNFPPQWTEWNGKYRDTVRDFWRGEPADARRVRLAPDRLGRPLRALRPPAGRIHQLRHGARRLHPARPRQLQREAQRGQRRGQQRRRVPQPLPELRGRGSDRRPRSPDAARATAAQLHRHAAALAGRADAAARRRARPHAAGQQQRLRAGQRAHVGALGQGRPAARGVHRRAGATAARASDVPSQPLLQRPPGRGGRSAQPVPDIAWLRPDGTEMQPEDWDSGFGRAVGVFLNGSGIRERDRRGEHDHRQALHRAVQRGRRRRRLPHARGRVQPASGTSSSTRPANEPTPRRSNRAPRSSCTPRRCWCSWSTTAPAAEVDHSVAASLAGNAVSTVPRTCPAPRPRPSCALVAMTKRPASTYRLQIQRGIRPRRGRPGRAATCATSAPTGRTCHRCCAATEGSDHGYDVVDPSLVDPARGGRGRPGPPSPRPRARRASASSSTSSRTTWGSRDPPQNPWWWDVLTHGRDSRYADAFDIDWDFGGGRVRVPILGAPSTWFSPRAT